MSYIDNNEVRRIRVFHDVDGWNVDGVGHNPGSCTEWCYRFDTWREAIDQADTLARERNNA